nr:helix-turn-helix domain-containing protein [Brevibacterium luteolum]
MGSLPVVVRWTLRQPAHLKAYSRFADGAGVKTVTHASGTPRWIRALDGRCPTWDSNVAVSRVGQLRRWRVSVVEEWEPLVSACQRARVYHEAVTVAAKEIELEAIGRLADAGVGVREIARMTQIPKSTVSRLMQDLPAAHRQLSRDRAGKPAALMESAREAILSGERS